MILTVGKPRLQGLCLGKLRLRFFDLFVQSTLDVSLCNVDSALKNSLERLPFLSHQLSIVGVHEKELLVHRLRSRFGSLIVRMRTLSLFSIGGQIRAD